MPFPLQLQVINATVNLLEKLSRLSVLPLTSKSQ